MCAPLVDRGLLQAVGQLRDLSGVVEVVAAVVVEVDDAAEVVLRDHLRRRVDAEVSLVLRVDLVGGLAVDPGDEQLADLLLEAQPAQSLIRSGVELRVSTHPRRASAGRGPDPAEREQTGEGHGERMNPPIRVVKTSLPEFVRPGDVRSPLGGASIGKLLTGSVDVHRPTARTVEFVPGSVGKSPFATVQRPMGGGTAWRGARCRTSQRRGGARGPRVNGRRLQARTSRATKRATLVVPTWTRRLASHYAVPRRRASRGALRVGTRSPRTEVCRGETGFSSTSPWPTQRPHLLSTP